MSEENKKSSPDSSRADGAKLRVDAAHVHANQAPSAPSAAGVQAALAGGWSAPMGDSTTVAALQQVRSQAAQLAVHLQRQQASVDHRESELNSRLAAMENQIRTARLWLNERQSELAVRQAELDRRELELSEREQQLDDATPGARKKPRDKRYTNDELAERVAELDRREAEIESLAARWAERVAGAEQVEDVQQLLRSIEARSRNLELAEKMLAEEQTALERQRQALAEDRATFTEQVQADRQRMAEEEQRAISERDTMRAELRRQSEELAVRQAALERTRGDIGRMQQESLEIRLATEELWAHLYGKMPPATVTQALAQTRMKIAEEHRVARHELAQQKADVQALATRVAEQHARLVRDREDFQGWAVERQRELEKHAAMVVVAQERAEQEVAEFEGERSRWQSERFRLQQEIRRLLRERDHSDFMAA